ncbi:PEP-CTERM sorting domain-containing protein [Desulfatitalea alkaliphila]|uniref:PEP-CTERM sorting domain-containing protein n=1 Tax=Desulfatitalea alkaliphila TaxID=2929485 RepID=A0AA41UKG2_9BACT|nr:PEP-CTERM sorting domain-containing protein [Desulfatitalea alkaliphila]MCJ8503040.1 PEP-CTERM sorting domain-containing protein [Desulfatitalea alkaliphila]
MKTNYMKKSKKSRRMVLAAVLAAIVLGLPMTLYIGAAISQSKKQSHSGLTNINTDIAPGAIAEENGATTDDSARGVQPGAMRRTMPVHASAARWTGDGAPYRNDPTGADYWLDTMTDGAAVLDSRATAPSRSNLAAYPGFGDHRSSLNGRAGSSPLSPPSAAAGMPQTSATPGSGPSAMPTPPGGAIQPAARPMDGLPPFGNPGNSLDPFAPDNLPGVGNPSQPETPASEPSAMPTPPGGPIEPTPSPMDGLPPFGDPGNPLDPFEPANPPGDGNPFQPETPGSSPSAMPTPPGGAIQPGARPMDGLPPFGEPGNPFDPFAPDNPPANGNPFQPETPAPAPVPEPATILMLAVGLLGIVAASARHTKRRGRQTPDPSNH